MRFDILTLFPEVFEPYLAASVLGRAREQKLFETQTWNVRDFATDKHKTTDDTPYGGGAGMVMKVEPIDQALTKLGQELRIKNEELRGRKVVVLSARGQQFTQAKAAEYAKLDALTLICGRYEGIDQRVADHLADEELSIGPYVLAGGELAALVVIEAVARLIPGVLGNPESLAEESFSLSNKLTKLPAIAATAASRRDGTSSIEYPQYTKPEEYKGWTVPSILLSGDHAAIKRWREDQRLANNSQE